MVRIVDKIPKIVKVWGSQKVQYELTIEYGEDPINCVIVLADVKLDAYLDMELEFVEVIENDINNEDYFDDECLLEFLQDHVS